MFDWVVNTPLATKIFYCQKKWSPKFWSQPSSIIRFFTEIAGGSKIVTQVQLGWKDGAATRVEEWWRRIFKDSLNWLIIYLHNLLHLGNVFNNLIKKANIIITNLIVDLTNCLPIFEFQGCLFGTIESLDL